MTPDLKAEESARVLIDEQLVQAGWVVQDRKDIDLVSHVGVAVREVFMEKKFFQIFFVVLGQVFSTSQ